MTTAATPFLARTEHFASVGSTNDVVRGWLREGTPEVCVAAADEQTAGRGRQGRTWTAPAGAALLMSVGFQPAWLRAEHVWRLGAVVSLAMATAAEDVADLPFGTVRLKWPNDLVALDEATGDVRKLAGVLGETEGLGTVQPRAVVGIGVNVDWARDEFPPDLAPTMTSLRELAPDRRLAARELERAFLDGLEHRVRALRAGAFDAEVWAARQVTTDRDVRIDQGDGLFDAFATGVDPDTGALRIADDAAPGGQRAIHAGEIVRLRLAGVARERDV